MGINKNRQSGGVKLEVIYAICTIALGFVLGILLWNEYVKNEKEEQELQILNQQIMAQRWQEEEERKLKEENDSFYQKLRDGYDVNLLIVGDSIGEGSGTKTKGKQWYEQLKSYLKEEYNIKVGLTNVSMGGNASYAGYVRTMALDNEIDYDLAILCYGQNDAFDGFNENYEAMIRAVMEKYPNCSIISILESSQREYTKKMVSIQELCKYYEIPVADTIKGFRDSGISYEKLADDGVHPNDAGQSIYFETVKNVIDKHVEISTGKMTLKALLNKGAEKYQNFAWYGVDREGFKRLNDTTYEIDITAEGILGIDYTYKSGNNKADIYIDGKLYKSPTVTFNYDFSQRHILVVSENCSVKESIRVVFSSKEQADSFYGMCFSWK